NELFGFPKGACPQGELQRGWGWYVCVCVCVCLCESGVHLFGFFPFIKCPLNTHIDTRAHTCTHTHTHTHTHTREIIPLELWMTQQRSTMGGRVFNQREIGRAHVWRTLT